MNETSNQNESLLAFYEKMAAIDKMAAEWASKLRSPVITFDFHTMMFLSLAPEKPTPEPVRDPRVEYYTTWQTKDVIAAAQKIARQVLKKTSKGFRWHDATGKELIEILGGELVPTNGGEQWYEKTDNSFKIGMREQYHHELFYCAQSIGYLVLFLGYPNKSSSRVPNRYDSDDCRIGWRSNPDCHAACHFAGEMIRVLRKKWRR